MNNYIIKLSATDTELYHSASWRRSGLQNAAVDASYDRGCDVEIVDSEGVTLFQVAAHRGGRA